MVYPRGISALVLLGCAVASWPAVLANRALAADAAAGTPPSLLLLRNGNVLEGQVTQAGDYYVVLLGASEIRLPARDVEAQVASLEEAYQLKKFGLFGRGAEPHVKLAEWCLRQGLFARCSEQLTEARRMEADDPGIALVERRLAQAREAKPTSTERARPASSLTVRSDDLEKTIRALPKASVERFAAVVQPLLLNRCGANQCHGANSKTEFHVLRPPGGQAATQRFTQRNLFAALQYLDRDDPEQSPLLALPQKRHGSSLVPVFDKQTQKQLDELRAWVKLAVAAPSPSPDAGPVQPATIPTAEAPALSQPATADPTTTPALQPAVHALPASGNQRGQDVFVPRDPFDPEIFNRRYKGPMTKHE